MPPQGSGVAAASDAVPGAVAPAAAVGRPDVVAYAKQFLGVKYVWAGASPSGFDCSGLVKYVYAHFGISMDHYTHLQWAEFPHVDKSQLLPGDIVFFNGVEHEGMYIGNGQFIQAPHTGDVVKISNLDDPWYASHYDGAVRPF
jgi:cell wall-associated NlpC family hydrolase